jgi:hypothetical protein
MIREGPCFSGIHMERWITVSSCGKNLTENDKKWLPAEGPRTSRWEVAAYCGDRVDILLALVLSGIFLPFFHF